MSYYEVRTAIIIYVRQICLSAVLYKQPMSCEAIRTSSY